MTASNLFARRASLRARLATPLALASLLATASAAACARPLPEPGVLGAYRFDDGRLVSIRRSTDKTLRARFYESGKSRRLYPERRSGGLRYRTGPGFATAEPLEARVEFQRGAGGEIDRLLWQPAGGPALPAVRVNRAQPVRFPSDGAMLAGRLDLPTAAGSRPRAAVVLVHGSGADAATELFYSGDFLAAHGVVTLTYDKRGTGGSEGEYTFDFDRLAGDAVAAVEYLSSRPETHGVAIGLSGHSQGAWTAPLAASMSRRIRFVVASYGLVASPAEEARVETRNLLRERGAAERDLEHVDRLTRAAVEVVASDFQDGWEELGRLKRRYRRASWLPLLRGTTVGRFVRYPAWLIRLLGPRLSPRGLPWHYDSMAVLAGLEIPMIWLIAEKDTSAPPELALPMLERLRAQGKPIEVRVFPGADHAMVLLPDGYAPGFFRAEVEAVIGLAGDPKGL